MHDIDLRITGDVQALRLQHGDIVVISVPEAISYETAAEIRAKVKEHLPNHDVMVLGHGMGILGIARSERFGRSEARAEVDAQNDTAAQIAQDAQIARTRLCDQMRELIEEARLTRDEIRRLRR